MSDAVLLPEPEFSGYTFKGWYTDAKFKKTATRISEGSVGNKKYYAKWVLNK